MKMVYDLIYLIRPMRISLQHVGAGHQVAKDVFVMSINLFFKANFSMRVATIAKLIMCVGMPQSEARGARTMTFTFTPQNVPPLLGCPPASLPWVDSGV